LGIASNYSEFILCNRADPWGFLRLSQPDSKTYQAQRVPVIEKANNQKMSFQTVTWNGQTYVSYLDATYLISGARKIFAVHDPKTLAIVSHYPGPDLIGGLAWDGDGYWAATRQNTANSGEPSYLYHLDKNFNVISKNEPPDVGCQGLAWDGSNLWFVDVFSRKIHVLDVNGDKPQVIYSYKTRFNNLSGVGFDGDNIWISEYDNHRMHRLKHEMIAQWTGRETESDQETAQQPEPAQVLTTQETPQINEDSPRSASYKNNAVEVGDEEMAVTKMFAEIRENTLYGSWKIYCGEKLFKEQLPEGSEESKSNNIKYTVIVEGESLSERKELEFKAEAGENIETDVELIKDLPQGRYSVSILLHAQYVNADGMENTINSSSPSINLINQ
ncbi:hypothetical protein L0244_22815, partial [bacterium]|nr:hypothetical protein [bacterium]